MTEPREIKVKGQSFRGFLTALEKLRGKVAVDETIRRLPDEVRDALRYGSLIPSGWYPMGWYRELHAAARAACGGKADLPRNIGREATRHDLSTVYKLLLGVMSPELLLKQAPRIFKMYCDGGTVEVTQVGKGHGRLHYRQCYGVDPNVFADLLGSTEIMLEAAGAKDISVELLSGGSKGDCDMEVQLRWS